MFLFVTVEKIRLMGKFMDALRFIRNIAIITRSQVFSLILVYTVYRKKEQS